MHDAYIGGRSENYIKCVVVHSCMTISGGRTEELDIIAGFLPYVTGFTTTSDFLSFIVCCGTYLILSRSPHSSPKITYVGKLNLII